ncbi:MAG: VOC family protein [Gammaproteobacteria bacterium]
MVHAGLMVADLEASLAFYQGELGLEVIPQRPDLGYPGAWLAVGTQQLHLMTLPNPDPVSGRPPHAGRDRHVAISVGDLESLRRRLEAASVAHTMSRSGRRALFCRDPDGNGLEFIERV